MKEREKGRGALEMGDGKKYSIEGRKGIGRKRNRYDRRMGQEGHEGKVSKYIVYI